MPISMRSIGGIAMKETKKFFCIFAAITTLFVPAFAAAQAAQKAGSDTYTWNAELVALDENARTLTVKSRVVGDQPMAELGKFKAGDRIVLTWSGFDKYADAINHAVRYDAAKKYEERFHIPGGIRCVRFGPPIRNVQSSGPSKWGFGDQVAEAGRMDHGHLTACKER